MYDFTRYRKNIESDESGKNGSSPFLRNMLFVKTCDYKNTYEYGIMASVPLSIWYKDETMAELEPIGPWEWVAAKGETHKCE